MVYDGPIGATAAHAHHAYQIVVSASGRLHLATRSERAAAEAAVIPPDELHAFEQSAPRAVLLYVAPESRVGRRLAALAPPRSRLATWIEAAASLGRVPLAELATSIEARAFADHLLDGLVGSVGPPRPWPPAIQRLVTLLPGRLGDAVRLPALARELGLSESRLSHLVTEHVGIPFRPYLRWLRLVRATTEIARGSTITEAAYAAGFSDGPHLTRAFRRMFGIAPSDVAGVATWHDL